MRSKNSILVPAVLRDYPGADFDLVDGLITRWRHEKPKPDQVELEAIFQNEVSRMAKELYREKRAAEYPSIQDQLDALWKGGADLEQMREKIVAVKAKYPKPSN